MSGDGGRLIGRRDFLRGTLALLASPPTLGLVALPLSASRARGAIGEPVLSLSEGTDYRASTVRAVEALGGMGRFVGPGMTVVVKPNIGWDRRVEQAANTHPEVVRAVCEMCIGAGAGKVTVLDRTCNDARRCYRTSGMHDMVQGLGDRRVSLDFVRDNRFRNTPFPEGAQVQRWPLYGPAMDADVLINVPVAKHHSISTVTLGMKNLMGIMGGNRGAFHSGIGQKLADLTSAVRPALTVLDATRILVRNGPSGGRLEDVRTLHLVAASTDPVAIDAYGTTLFDLEPAQVSSVLAGYRMGLGEMDLSRVRTVRA